MPEIKEFTKPLFSIPSHHFLFNPGNISPTAFIDTLQLEESEYGLIKYPERGTCLYRCRKREIFVTGHRSAVQGCVVWKRWWSVMSATVAVALKKDSDIYSGRRKETR